MLQFVLLFLYASAALAAHCKLSRVSNPKSTRCGGKFMVWHSEVRYRRFHTPSVDTCNSVGYHDPNAVTYAYNHKFNYCTFYSFRPAATKNATSDTQVFNRNCFKRTGFCPPLNGDFEDNVRGLPVRNGINVPLIGFLPWEQLRTDSSSSIASVASNNKSTIQTPSGDRYLYGYLPSSLNHKLNLLGRLMMLQAITLEPNSSYTVSFLYNLIAAQGPTAGTFGNVAFDVYLEEYKNTQLQTTILTNDTTLGKWTQYTSEPFTIGPKPGDSQTLVIAGYIDQSTVKSATLGLDNIVVTPVINARLE